MILRKRIFLRLSVLLLAMIGAITVTLVVFTVHKQRGMGKEVHLSIGNALAGEIERYLLWDDRVAVRQALEREMESHKLFDYVFVVRDGRPYVSAFGDGVPEELLRPDTLHPESAFVWEFRSSEGGVHYDLVVPIGQTGGVLRIGIERSRMDRHVLPVIRAILFISLVALLLGLAIAFRTARRATKEITLLCNAIRSFGGPGGERALGSGDTPTDVAELAGSFRSLVSDRKQAEQAVYESQQNLAITLDSIGDAVIATDMQERVTRMNPVAEALTGWAVAEALGRPLDEVFNIIQGQTRQKAENPVDQVLREGRIVGLANHIVLIARDGTEYQIADSAAPIRNADGETFGVVLVFHDVTGDYAKAQALRESEARFKTLHNATFGGIAIHDQGVILECNLGLSEISGYQEQELIGMDGLLLIAEESREMVREHIRSGYESPYEAVGLRKDGSEYPLRLAASNIPYQGINARVVEFRDITERKRAEAEKDRLMAAIDQAAETIVITDAAGTIRYVNPAFEKITGYACEEAVGQNPRILKSGEQNDAFYQGMWNTLLRGAIWSGRMVNRRKDGKHYTEEAKISPVKDSAGKTINYVAVKRDVTAELAREEKYRQAQKMETVGQLAGGIAHDFNNILQSISGFCEILVMEMDQCIDGQPADYVAQLADVEEIHKAARHAADLTRQLLTFSRNQSTEQREIDLNAVLADGMRMIEQGVDESIKLEYQPAPEPLTVHANASQMMQIVMNLVVNARDAMPSGGTVAIAAEAVRIGLDDVAGMARSRAGEFVCLSVSDTGTGMDANQLAHLFEPFFTSKEIGKGTGLGLSVVYGIVQSHHGWIDVDSTVGAGTTFRIYLPVYDGAAVNPADAPPDREAVVLGRILLVEDDPVVRNLTGEILKGMGYAVFAAGTAREAGQLFAAENGAFDLLLIDVMLPDGNGIKLAETLLGQTAGVPVLLCSGSDGQANSERAAQKGFDYMPKPYGLRTLLDAVGKSLQRT